MPIFEMAVRNQKKIAHIWNEYMKTKKLVKSEMNIFEFTFEVGVWK